MPCCVPTRTKLPDLAKPGHRHRSHGPHRIPLRLPQQVDLRDPGRSVRGNEQRAENRALVGTRGLHQHDSRARLPPGRPLAAHLHGPDGKEYPNESRFSRIDANRIWEIEHLSGHHFFLAIELQPVGAGTLVAWRQTFDTKEHYESIAALVATANEQNLERLAAEVRGGAA